MDSLIENLQNLSSGKNDGMGDHPRYTMFKNLGKAADAQAARRKEALERISDGRSNLIDKMRKLAHAEELSDSEAEEESGETEAMDGEGSSDMTETGNQGRVQKKPNRYENVLMTSEWLVDIPTELSSKWIMLVAPKGKRVLVVATKGTTTAFDKRGRIVNQFASMLPGSGTQKASYSILDCIMDSETHTMHVLDMMCWNEMTIADSTFDCRSFFLQSRFEENPQLGNTSRRIKYKFVVAPRCRCDKGEMEQLMRTEFEFRVDGLLFYYSEVIYTPGQSPLVGWLKPFMLPEILGVEIPASFSAVLGKQQSSAQYIEEFNKKHQHHSQVQKEDDQEME